MLETHSKKEKEFENPSDHAYAYLDCTHTYFDYAHAYS